MLATGHAESCEASEELQPRSQPHDCKAVRLFPGIASASLSHSGDEGKDSAPTLIHCKGCPREIYLAMSKLHGTISETSHWLFKSEVSSAITKLPRLVFFFSPTLVWKSFKALGKNRCIIKMNKSWWCSVFQKKRKKTVNDTAADYISLAFLGPGHKASFSIKCG